MRASAWCYIVMWLFLTHSWHHTKHYSIDCMYWLSETFWKDFSILWGIQYNLFILANMKSIYRVFQKNFTIHMTVQARQIFSTHCSSYFPWQQTLKSFPILFCFSLSRHPCFTCFSLFYRQSVNIGDSTKSLGIWKLKYL